MPRTVVSLLALLALAGCGSAARHAATTRTAPAPKAPHVAGAKTLAARFAGIPERGRILGRPDAPYTLVEFADLQCPFCAAFDREVLPTVLRRYVRPGRLRIELRLVAFIGPQSGTAALLGAAAALQDRLWQFADLVYRNQGRENSGYWTDAYARTIAGAVPGLDYERMQRDARRPPVLASLHDDAREARTAAVTGTPGLRIGRTGGVLAQPLIGGVKPGPFLRLLARTIRP